ncbi:MAG: tetratricopeptide repeat protein [Candidatus Thiodiazotropha sp.]
MGRLIRHLVSGMILLGSTGMCSAGGNEEGLIQQANRQSEAGNLEQAQSLLMQAIEVAPDSTLAYSRLGGIQLLRQEYAPSIDNFQKAIMLDSENADAFIGLSIAYLHMGRYSLAREALHEASRLEPTKKSEINDVLAWLNQREGAGGH